MKPIPSDLVAEGSVEYLESQWRKHEMNELISSVAPTEPKWLNLNEGTKL